MCYRSVTKKLRVVNGFFVALRKVSGSKFFIEKFEVVHRKKRFGKSLKCQDRRIECLPAEDQGVGNRTRVVRNLGDRTKGERFGVPTWLKTVSNTKG